jgi:propionyl-CoA synthetase
MPEDRSASVALVDWIRKPREGSAVASLNACYNALDRHVVRGHGDRTALVYDAPAGALRLSFAELLERTAAFAGALRGLGVARGAHVVLSLPDVPEAVVATLACARIGAVHVGVPETDRADGLARRFVTGEVAAVVTSAGHEPAVREALERAEHPPVAVVVVDDAAGAPAADPRYVDWDTALRAGAADPAGCVEVPAEEPLAEVWRADGDPVPVRTGDHVVALADSVAAVLTGDSEAVWWSTWPLASAPGPDYCVYAPLLGAATTLLRGQAAAAGGAFWEVVAEHGVDTVLTDAATVRAVAAAPSPAAPGLRALVVPAGTLEPGARGAASAALHVPVLELAPAPGLQPAPE